MSYISRDYRCAACGHTWDDLVLREHQDDMQMCPSCFEEAGKKCMLKAPGITNHSYVDGTKRKGFQELKEANKLTREMYNLPHEKREEIRKEINKLKSTKGEEEK